MYGSVPIDTDSTGWAEYSVFQRDKSYISLVSLLSLYGIVWVCGIHDGGLSLMMWFDSCKIDQKDCGNDSKQSLNVNRTRWWVIYSLLYNY